MIIIFVNFTYANKNLIVFKKLTKDGFTLHDISAVCLKLLSNPYVGDKEEQAGLFEAYAFISCNVRSTFGTLGFSF